MKNVSNVSKIMRENLVEGLVSSFSQLYWMGVNQSGPYLRLPAKSIKFSAIFSFFCFFFLHFFRNFILFRLVASVFGERIKKNSGQQFHFAFDIRFITEMEKKKISKSRKPFSQAFHLLRENLQPSR